MIHVRDWLRKPRFWGTVAASFLGVGAFCLLSAVGHEKHEMVCKPPPKSSFFYSKCECDELISKFPEVMWLEGAEQICNALAGDGRIAKRAYSFDQAVKGIYAVHMFVDGGYPEYLEFVHSQNRLHRLTWDQFCVAKDEIKYLLDHFPGFSRKELVEVIQFCMVLYEMKYSETMQSRAWLYGVKNEDQYDLYREVITEHLDIFPSYSNLSLKQQRLIHKVVTKAPLERMFYFSSVYDIMSRFEGMKSEPGLRDIFDLAFFIHQCRVAGRGIENRIDVNASLDRRVFDHHALFKKACILASESGLKEGYDYYLSKRGEWLGFDVSSPLNRTLCMIGSLLNCYTEVEGAIIKEAFLSLSHEQIAYFSSEIDRICTVGDGDYRYITHLMNNLKKSPKIGGTEEKRLANATTLGLPFISAILSQVDQMNLSPEYSIDFYEIAFHALDDPEKTVAKNVEINRKGKVIWKKPIK